MRKRHNGCSRPSRPFLLPVKSNPPQICGKIEQSNSINAECFSRCCSDGRGQQCSCADDVVQPLFCFLSEMKNVVDAFRV